MVEVEVYTNRGCSACVNVKQYLDRKGIEYVEKKLGKSRKTDLEFSIRTKNAKKIPQVFINGEWIGGFDDVVRYDRAGELDWRLGLSAKPKVGAGAKIIRFLKGEKY
tara:strand:- start:1123 stop:1443 length:321 start_codon:yes stop_codon:yes gene_type:complete